MSRDYLPDALELSSALAALQVRDPHRYADVFADLRDELARLRREWAIEGEQREDECPRCRAKREAEELHLNEAIGDSRRLG